MKCSQEAAFPQENRDRLRNPANKQTRRIPEVHPAHRGPQGHRNLPVDSNLQVDMEQ